VVDALLWKQAYLALPVAELLPGLVDPDSGESLGQVASVLCTKRDHTMPGCPGG